MKTPYHYTRLQLNGVLVSINSEMWTQSLNSYDLPIKDAHFNLLCLILINIWRKNIKMRKISVEKFGAKENLPYLCIRFRTKNNESNTKSIFERIT